MRQMLALAWKCFHIIRKGHDLNMVLRNVLMVFVDYQCPIAYTLVDYDKMVTQAQSVHVIMEHGNVTIRIINKL